MIWLQGLHSCLIPGVVFIIVISFSRCRAEVFLAAHSAGSVLPFSQGAWETSVFFFTTKSLRGHSQQEVKQFKCLQISFFVVFFFASYTPNKQTPDDSRCRVTAKQTVLFVEGGIRLDFFFLFWTVQQRDAGWNVWTSRCLNICPLVII